MLCDHVEMKYTVKASKIRHPMTTEEFLEEEVDNYIVDCSVRELLQDMVNHVVLHEYAEVHTSPIIVETLTLFSTWPMCLLCKMAMRKWNSTCQAFLKPQTATDAITVQFSQVALSTVFIMHTLMLFTVRIKSSDTEASPKASPTTVRAHLSAFCTVHS